MKSIFWEKWHPFVHRRAVFYIWAKLEELTGDGWPFTILYRKIIKNHYPSTRKHSSRMYTVHCHGHWEGGLCLPRGCLPGDVCPGVCLPGGVSARRGCICVCQGVSPRRVSGRGHLLRGCVSQHALGWDTHTSPWTEWQMLLKILPCHNYVWDDNKVSLLHLHLFIISD